MTRATAECICLSLGHSAPRKAKFLLQKQEDCAQVPDGTSWSVSVGSVRLRPTRRRGRLKMVDFFSGCGGTSAGFKRAGIDVVLGIDNDEVACETFSRNFPEATVLCKDIRRLRPSALADSIRLKPGERLIFSACAPCQPFSKQRRMKRKSDERATLLFSFIRFVKVWKPHYIFVENVPGIQKIVRQKNDFEEFISALRRLGYEVEMHTVQARHYGVPQKRPRLVVMASRVGRIEFPRKTHGPHRAHPYSTAWAWIRSLPKIVAGERHPSVPNHWAARLSTLNQKRIKATPEGGGRGDWPKRLRLECHRGYDGHSDVYGRMRKNAPAPGLTTRCISLSNGRFGHPIQDRAISVREAARLQTFDDSFVFDGTLIQAARQVGNAVPVLLAERFGRQYVRHAKSR